MEIATEGREQKHVVLDSKVRANSIQINTLECLISKLEKGEMPKDIKEPEEIPTRSFADTLNCLPSEIEDNNQRLMDIHKRLTEILF